MRRLVNVLLFLMLVDEGAATNNYAKHMFAPFAWVKWVLFEPILKSVRPFDVIMAGILVYSSMTAKGQQKRARLTRPMRSSLFVAAGVTVGWFVYGLARGGDARAASWQIYLLLATVLAAFAFASVCKTAEHFIGLLNTVLAAGLYHAVMAILFHLLYVAPGKVDMHDLGDYLTTHDDTVLWTIGIGFSLMRFFQTPGLRARLPAALGIVVLMVAIQLNHRRIAWISLGGGLTAMYFLIPPNAVKRRLRRIATVLVPVLALYALVGWGRPEGIFRPLRAFESVSSAQDNSTKARNVENLGLIATANQGWLMGTGWGHKYVEISSKYQIYFFELWPYVPHNSVLGLFAYTGYLGFLGYWMTIPTAAFLHARTARFAPRPAERLVGVVGVMQLVSCADQWFGDMGSFSSVTNYTLATCFAAALRIPASSGAWPDGTPAKPATSGDAPAPTPMAPPPRVEKV